MSSTRQRRTSSPASLANLNRLGSKPRWGEVKKPLSLGLTQTCREQIYFVAAQLALSPSELIERLIRCLDIKDISALLDIATPEQLEGVHQRLPTNPALEE